MSVALFAIGTSGWLRDTCDSFRLIKDELVKVAGAPGRQEQGPCEKAAEDAVLYESSCAAWTIGSGTMALAADMTPDNLRRGRILITLETVHEAPTDCAPRTQEQ